MDQKTRSGQEKAIDMLQHVFSFYGLIGEIDLKENVVKMMGAYDSSKLLACLIKKLEIDCL